MTFAKPEFLYGLLLIPAAALFLWWARKQHQNALSLLGEEKLIRKLTANINWSGKKWKTILQIISLH